MSEPCSECGAKPFGGKVRVHKKGCPIAEPNQEVIRTPETLPQVGDWYVLNFATPMGCDAATNRRIYTISIALAPVKSIHTHGKDFRVIFDGERHRGFTASFYGELFTEAGKVVKALRDLADLVERGSK